MSRILLVGEVGDAGFAPLRTRHFAAVLPGAEVVDWRDGVARRAVAAPPALLVTASNHGPTRAALQALDALRAAGHAPPPFWLDVAGDPFAEAQAHAASDPSPGAVAAESVAVWAPAIARADAFSTVSQPGRHALLGALGALGRLPLIPPGQEPVHVLPCATDFPDDAGPARAHGLHVALMGGFNTWFDDETLLAGLLLAMDRAPVQVTVLGGPVPGHHTRGYARFSAGVTASRHARRFSFRPWLPHHELAAALAPCHVSICLDRPGPEAELGARTRVLHALHHGLRVLATACAPVVRELVDAGLVEALPAAHEAPEGVAAATLAESLLRAHGAPPQGLRTAWLAARSAVAVGRPLRDWAANPLRMPPATGADVLAAALGERDRARAELARLQASPTFKALDRLRRRLRSPR